LHTCTCTFQVMSLCSQVYERREPAVTAERAHESGGGA
jgi:hypothetical protein